MDANQLYNLVGFTILFKNSLMESDMEYIKEKYIKMIGVVPEASLKKLGGESLQDKENWMKKWKVSKFKTGDENIINYLFFIDSYNISELTINIIVKSFDQIIGDSEKINNNIYNHIHPVFKDYIFDFMNKHKSFKFE